MPSFDSKKALRFIITLGTAKFGTGGFNRITLQGYRAVADIDKAGGMMMSTLRAKIYGMRQEDMNSATTLQWKPGSTLANTVEVFAIDGKQETLVFAGNIVNAWADYSAMPDVFLQIQAQAAYFSQMLSSKPRSFSGPIDAALVMGQIASDLGLQFENAGVKVILQDLYLANTATEQARELARIANIDLYVDDKILAIAPRNQARNVSVPRISKGSGLVGYPTFDGVGVNFQTLFNPAVTFGGKIDLVTEIPQARGEWIVTSMAHRLESEKPGGAWFSTVRGNRNGLAIAK